MSDTQVIDAPAEAPEVEVEATVEHTPEATTDVVTDDGVAVDVEETAPIAPAPRTGNAAWASEADRQTITAVHAKLRAAGYTRPMINKATGFSDSATWRAQNDKVHTYELEAWLTYFRSLPMTEDGKGFLPAPGSKQAKPKVEDLQAQLAAQAAEYQAKIDAAVATLGGEAKTTTQYRKLVEAAVESLTA